jgi:glucose-1-phosphatase
MADCPRLVIFDMDEVLFRLNRKRRLHTLAALTGLPPERIDETIWRSGFDDDCDRGRYSAEECHRETCARLGVRLSVEELIGARITAMAPIASVWRMAAAVRQRAALAMLTNNNLLLKRELPRHFPQVPELFGAHAFFSAELGLSKPDPEIFREVARRVGQRPEETLLIDDGAGYVEGARAAGLQAHRFRTSTALRQELHARGLL